MPSLIGKVATVGCRKGFQLRHNRTTNGRPYKQAVLLLLIICRFVPFAFPHREGGNRRLSERFPKGEHCSPLQIRGNFTYYSPYIIPNPLKITIRAKTVKIDTTLHQITSCLESSPWQCILSAIIAELTATGEP